MVQLSAQKVGVTAAPCFVCRHPTAQVDVSGSEGLLTSYESNEESINNVDHGDAQPQGAQLRPAASVGALPWVHANKQHK
jgi:hypothetical protein